MRLIWGIFKMSMDAKARKALSVIQRCVAAKRYVVLPHFVQRMDQRGFFWADVLAVLDEPDEVRFDGHDRYARPKWVIEGKTVGELDIGLVCVLDTDDRGRVTVFITIY